MKAPTSTKQYAFTTACDGPGKEIDVSEITDTERLQWLLRYGHLKTLGVAQDFDYIPVTLELVDREIAREKAVKVKE